MMAMARFQPAQGKRSRAEASEILLTFALSSPYGLFPDPGYRVVGTVTGEFRPLQNGYQLS